MGWVWIPRLLRCGEVQAMEEDEIQVRLYGEKNTIWVDVKEIEWITNIAKTTGS